MVIIIVNFIGAAAILLGGAVMLKYAESHADYSIGFRTRRAMSSEEAWRFANRSCGIAWLIIGAVCALLTTAALVFARDSAYAQIGVLILLTASVMLSATATEIRLKHKFG